MELANPYRVPARVANLCLMLRDGKSYTVWGQSNDLGSYVAAADGLARDAEGYWVLKPGEKIIFYRNGTEVGSPTPARFVSTRPGMPVAA